MSTDEFLYSPCIKNLIFASFTLFRQRGTRVTANNVGRISAKSNDIKNTKENKIVFKEPRPDQVDLTNTKVDGRGQRRPVQVGGKCDCLKFSLFNLYTIYYLIVWRR